METALDGFPDAMDGLDALHALDDAPLGVVRAELQVAAPEVVDANIRIEHEEQGLLQTVDTAVLSQITDVLQQLLLPLIEDQI